MMDAFRSLFGRKQAAAPRPLPPPEPEPEEDPVVPEIGADDLRGALEAGEHPLLLDIREGYEWRQAHLPTDRDWEVRHLPMDSVPDVVADLPRDRRIVVICAHGSRSYGVAHYLNEQGLDAVSLRGGLSGWAATGGPTMS